MDETLTADKFVVLKHLSPVIALDPFAQENVTIVNTLFDSLFNQEVTLANQRTHITKYQEYNLPVDRDERC